MKYYGVIGYAETVETEPGIWTEEITEHYHYGDVISNKRMLQSNGQVNDNVNVSNLFSIVADPYANQHFHEMRYIEFMGTKWKITSADVQYPRIVLTVGGVYNA